MICDLLYLETLENVEMAEAAIAAQYPQAKMERDHDFIHEWRLVVELDVELEEWAVFAIKEGFALSSFDVGTQLLRDCTAVKGWLEKAGIPVEGALEG
jgi:hypothetical protein